MKKYVTLIIIWILCLSSLAIFANIPIVYKNIDDINNIHLQFSIIDNSNQIAHSLSLSEGKIELFDNGTKLNINEFNPAKPPNDNANIAICFDLSISNRTNDINDFIFAKDATIKCLSYMNPTTKVALLSVASISCIEMNFTDKLNEVANAINSFQTGNTNQTLFVNLYKGITSEYVSGISILTEAQNTNKTLLLVTQGTITNDETELIISKAKQENVRINIIYVNEIIPANIKQIAQATKGFCISKKLIESNYLPFLSTMAKLSEGYSPYEIKAAAEINCSGEHNFELKTANYGTNSFFENINSKQITLISGIPAFLEFPAIKPSTTATQNVDILAQNADINIENIKVDNSLFSITTLPNLPLKLKKDSTIQIEISFKPTDSAIVFGRLLIESNACNYDTLFLTGGYPNVAPNVKAINIIAPKCNEVLVVGDTAQVTWTGVLAQDIVSLNTQTQSNQLDTFALNVTGLSHKYYVKDNLNTDSIRFVINQMWPNNVGKTLTFSHTAPVLSAFFNVLEDKVITFDNNRTVSVWNANSGALIHRFAQFHRDVKWAKFIKSPNSNNDKYIAIACADSCAYLFDAEDYSLIWRHKTSAETVFSIESSHDGKYAVVALENGYFDILDLENKELKLRQKIPAATCRYATFHPAKQYEIMTISSYRGVLHFYDIEGNYVDSINATGGKPTITSHYTTYNYDGSKILFINFTNETADLIDRQSKQILHSFRHAPTDGTVTFINFASFFHLVTGQTTEDYVLTAGSDKILRRWNVSDFQPSPLPSVFLEHSQAINTGIFSSDGWRLLSASTDSTAKIWNLNQKVLQTDTSCPLRVAIAKCEIVDTIFCNDTYIGEVSIKTLKKYFTNISDFGYNIRAIRIAGNNPEDFSLVDEFEFPININALATLDFTLTFRPQTEGTKTAQLQIIIPNDTIYIQIIGNGINIGLQPLCELINFGNIYINDYKDTTVAIAINQSNANISIEEFFIAGPGQSNYKLLAPNANNVLKSKDTLFAKIRFYSLKTGKINAAINIRHSYNSFIVKWNLLGYAVELAQDTVTLKINDFSAKIGELKACPIHINTTTKYQNIDIDTIKFSMEFNATLLHPQVNSSEVEILNDKYIGDNKRIVELSIPYKPGSQRIDGLQFLALLGNDTASTIKILNCSLNSNIRVAILSSDCLFTLQDYCTAGGIKLFDANGSFMLEQNIPNPANNETKIEFEILEPGETSLDIYSMAGNHVKNLFKKRFSKGKYSIDIDTHDIPAGSYYYILNGASEQVSKTMIIEK